MLHRKNITNRKYANLYERKWVDCFLLFSLQNKKVSLSAFVQIGASLTDRIQHQIFIPLIWTKRLIPCKI